MQKPPAFRMKSKVFAFAVAMALLITMAFWLLPDSETFPNGGSLHLTQADWQIVDGKGFGTPAPTVDSNALPNTWQPAVLPQSLQVKEAHQGHAQRPTSAADTTRVTWIRLVAPDVPQLSKKLALYGARINTNGTIAVYVDGHLVHTAQQQGALWNSVLTPLWVALDQRTDGAAYREILIRLEHTPSSQVAMSSLWLGSAKALRDRYYARQFLQQELPEMLSAAFLAIGIFALFLWLKRPKEIDYFLFFTLAVVSFGGHMHYYVSKPMGPDWFAWMTSNALFWMLIVVHIFLCRLHGQPVKNLTRFLVAVVSLISLLTLPSIDIVPIWPSTSILIPLVFGIAVLMAATVAIVGGINSWKNSRDGRLMAFGVAAGTLLGFSDWLVHNGVISTEHWFLGAYTNAVTFAVFGALMYRRYLSAITEVEQLNASLAQRLQARETELEVIHQHLREAALRQTISDERQRLMQDMHDGLGSSLISAIRMADSGGMSDAKVAQILKDCLDDLKLTIDSMEPIEADLLLLLATLRFRLEPRLEGTGIALRWEVQELPIVDWLDPSSALHILRIVQESIANILRHTNATEIRVGTALEATGVRVTIEDNGQGFDVDQALASASGRGLHNQQRRAQAIEGTVHWQSGAKGTVFSLWLPLVRIRPN
jgi:signal transduction histidine kinase